MSAGDDMDDVIGRRKFGTFGPYRSRTCSRRFILLVTLTYAAVVVAAAASSSSSSSSSSRITGRSVFRENLAKRQAHRNVESSKLVPCTTTFVDQYFEQTDRITLVLPDAMPDVPELAVQLMSELHSKCSVYTLTVGMMSTVESYEDWADMVLLSENASDFDRLDICITDYCRRNCRFVIALTSSFVDERSFLAETDALVQRVCFRSIFKLAIVALVGDSVLHAGVRSIRDNNMFSMARPVLLSRCESVAATVRWQEVAREASVSFDIPNEVNAAMFENFPYAMLINETSGSPRFDGVEGLMIEEIARRMGVKLNRETIVWTNTTVEWQVYERLYESTKNDLVFGGLLWNTSRTVEFTHSYGLVYVAWIVPVSSHVSLYGLTAPFESTVWYTIFCILLVGGLVKLFLFRDITFLDIASILFGVAVNRQPTKLSSRINFMAWTLFSFFLAQFYLASLADYLVNATDDQIDTIEEMVDSDLLLGGSELFTELFEKKGDKEEDDDVRRKIRENFIVFSQHDYISNIQDIVNGINTSLAMIVALNLTDFHHMSNLKHAHIVKEFVGSFPLGIATWRGFQYLDNINFNIYLLLQTGLIDFWSDMMTFNQNLNRHEKMEDEKNGSILELDDMSPAFFLLLIGFLAGCCLLFVEILFYPSKIFL